MPAALGNVSMPAALGNVSMPAALGNVSMPAALGNVSLAGGSDNSGDLKGPPRPAALGRCSMEGKERKSREKRSWKATKGECSKTSGDLGAVAIQGRNKS